MKIVFFGTGEFSARILSGLLEKGRDVVAVVSQIEKINARNNRIIFSPVKELCIKNNIGQQISKPLHDSQNHI